MSLLTLLARRRGGIPRANLLAEYRLDEGAGQWAYNRARTPAVTQVNLLSNLDNFEAWTTNTTLTRDFAADPDGGDSAARFVTGVGSLGNLQQSVAQPAATLTMSVWAISNTGGTQTFRLSLDGGSTFAVCTATTAWQRFTQTVTVTAATRSASVFTASGNPGCDILLYGLQLEAGASASAYIAPRLDLHLGTTGAAESADPTWANGGLHWSGTTMQAAGALAPGLAVADVTLYVLARWTDGAVTPATRETHLLGEINTNLINLLGSRTATNPWPTARHSGTDNIVEGKNIKIDDGNWFVLGYGYDTATQTQHLWYNGYEFATRGRTNAPITLRHLYLGGRLGSANTWPGDIAYALAYTACHNAAQALATTRALVARAALRGITVPAIDRLVVVEGDSISAGWDAANGDYSWYALPNFASRPYCANQAIPGSLVHTNNPASVKLDDPTRVARDESLFDPARARNILSLLIGSNDLAADGDSGLDLYNEIKAYCQARKAALTARGGTLRIALGTILPRADQGPTLDTRRLDCNTRLRNAISEGWADAIFDFGADATMGPYAAASNISLYMADTIHPQYTAQNTYLAPLWRAAVEALL